MTSRTSINIRMIEFVASRLGDLIKEVAFLGGATVALFLTDPSAPDVRSTKDVDLILHAMSRSDYYRFEEKLRNLGFVQLIEQDIPICRWVIDNVMVDVMPTDESILGFSNRWYSEAAKNAKAYRISSEVEIRLVTAPYFLAAKIEAFYGRGGNDYLSSADIEDIVSIIDGRSEILDEIYMAENELRSYLAEQFRMFLSNPFFIEALPGHLFPDEASQARLDILIEKMHDIASLNKVEV